MSNITVWNKLLVLLFSMGIGGVYANPQLDTVVSGNVSVSQTANSTTVNQSSQKAIINWNSFNISAGEATRFVQPNASSVALNRIDPAQGASQIYGSLSANGQIILINAAGIHFGPSAMVNVGGLIASTSDISNENFLAGIYKFDQPSPFAASIVNEGTIIAANHGLIALIGHTVQNDGLIQAELGSIVLASGNKFTLDFYGDQLINFSVDDGSIGGKVTNNGTLLADGGSILVSAKTAQTTLDNVINLNGVAQARSIDEHNGEIILTANGSIHVTGTLDAAGMSDQAVGGKIKILGDYIHFASTAKLDASGNVGGGEILIGGNYQGKGPEQNALGTTVDAGAVINADAITSGDGGKVIVWSDGATEFHGNISARGGAQSGNGGLVETSGHYLDIENASVTTLANNGLTGSWLLDPTTITISSASNNNINASNNTYQPTDGSLASSTLLVSTLNAALASNNVTVTTTPFSGSGGGGAGDIIVAANIGWSSDTTLTLSAYRDITVNNGMTITNSSTGSGAGLILRADNTGTGTGTINLVNNFGVATQVQFSNGSNKTISFYYNPTSFASPTNFLTPSSGGKVSPGTATFTAYMYVNSLGASIHAPGARSLGALSNPANSSLWSESYALNKSINASTTNTWNGGQGFSPIGNNTTPFSGKFDGLGYTISGLTINRTVSSGTNHMGLFGNNTGTIQNLGVINASVTATASGSTTLNNGILAGSNSGTISNSYVTGSSWANIGSGSTLVALGGLVGNNTGSISRSFSGNGLVNANGTTSTSPFFAGGLVGSNSGGGTITDSYSLSNLAYASTSGSTAGSVGGLVGSNGAATPHTSGAGTINNSYSIGTLYSGTGIITSGGLVGYAGTGSTVNSSYWNTNTSGLNASYGGSPLTTAQLQNALPSGFSPSIWGIISDTSFPYFLSQYTSTPRVISGYTSTFPPTLNNDVQLAINGTNISNNGVTSQGTLSSYANGFFYSLQANGAVADSSPITISTLDTLANYITTTPAANGSLLLASGDIVAQKVTTTIALTSLTRATSSFYTRSGNNITLNSNFSLNALNAYSLDGNITTSGTGGMTFNGALTLGANATLTTASGNITIANGASGSGFDLTLAGGSGNNIFNIAGNLALNSMTVTGGAGTNDLNFGNYTSAISANLTADHVGTISDNGTQIASFSGIHNLAGNDQGLISVSGALNNSSLYITSLGQGYIQGSSAFPTNFTRFTNPVPSPNVASASNNSNTSSPYVGSTNSSSTGSGPATNDTTNNNSFVRFVELQLVVNTLSASNPNTTNNFGNNNAVVSANNMPGYNTNYNHNPFNPIFMSGSGSSWSSGGAGQTSSGNTSGNNSDYGNNSNSNVSAANSTTPLFNPAAANLTFNFNSMMDQITSTDISIAESQSISTSCN